MKLRLSLLLACVVSSLALATVGSAPALGDYPLEGGGSECTADLEGAEVTLSPSNQKWVCRYDPELEDYFWEPLAAMVLPEDAVAYKTQNATASDGVTARITARVEWINNVLYSGTDVFLRKPITSPLLQPPSWVGVWTRVYTWDGTSWSLCKESPGWAKSAVQSDYVVKTINWGRAPCGSKWYAASSFVERWQPELSQYVVENAGQAVSTYSAGAVNLGTARNGQVWDPAPGDKDKKPPKPADMDLLKEKLKKEKAPAPTTPEAPLPSG